MLSDLDIELKGLIGEHRFYEALTKAVENHYVENNTSYSNMQMADICLNVYRTKTIKLPNKDEYLELAVKLTDKMLEQDQVERTLPDYTPNFKLYKVAAQVYSSVTHKERQKTKECIKNSDEHTDLAKTFFAKTMDIINILEEDIYNERQKLSGKKHNTSGDEQLSITEKLNGLVKESLRANDLKINAAFYSGSNSLVLTLAKQRKDEIVYGTFDKALFPESNGMDYNYYNAVFKANIFLNQPDHAEKIRDVMKYIADRKEVKIDDEVNANMDRLIQRHKAWHPEAWVATNDEKNCPDNHVKQTKNPLKAMFNKLTSEVSEFFQGLRT